MVWGAGDSLRRLPAGLLLSGAVAGGEVMRTCMGLEVNRKRCMTCKRLPQTPEDEGCGEEGWLDHLVMQHPCVAYKALKKRWRKPA